MGSSYCTNFKSILKQTIEILLQHILRVLVYLDFILVAGASEEEHTYSLTKVLPYNGNNSRKKKFAICPALFYSRENIRECKTILLKYKYTIHSAHAIQQENVHECTRNRENREHFLSRTIPDIRYLDCEKLVSRDKCEFIVPTVQYLGYLINASGLRTSNKKLKAAQDMPAPKNVTLLGLIISLNMATKFAPLYSIGYFGNSSYS